MAVYVIHTCIYIYLHTHCCIYTCAYFHMYSYAQVCTHVIYIYTQTHVHGVKNMLQVMVSPSRCSVLQCDTVLQCVAVWCSVVQCGAVWCSVLQCVAVCCSVLQCVAACCSVLQCVAACCSVLQCYTIHSACIW